MSSDENDPIEPFEGKSSISRALSIVTALVYLIFAMVQDDPRLALDLTVFAVVPVICIWFPDVVADRASGLVDWGGPAYDLREGFVVGAAWVALLAPIWVGVLGYLLSR